MSSWSMGMAAVAVACGCGRIAFQPAELGDATPSDVTIADPVTLVNSASAWSTATVTSQPVAFTTDPTAGNLLVVSISTSFEVPTSVTDNAGNTYVRAPSSPTMNSSTYCNIFVYYARDIVTATDFVTTVSGPDDHISVAVHELAGADPQSPLAADLLQNGNGTTPTCGPIQSDIEGSLYLATLCHNSTRTTTVGSGYQIVEAPTEEGNNNSALVTAYKAGDASPTSISATLSSSDDWQVILAAFH